LNKATQKYRGWVLGHFINEDSPFKTQNVEVKWGVHKEGESKANVEANDTASSLAVLIRGKFALSFPAQDKNITLENEGDYVFYGPDTPHSWQVLEDCLVITIRWPSIPKDQKVV